VIGWDTHCRRQDVGRKMRGQGVAKPFVWLYKQSTLPKGLVSVDVKSTNSTLNNGGLASSRHMGCSI